jgi:hypothetical protein
MTARFVGIGAARRASVRYARREEAMPSALAKANILIHAIVITI